jgi:HlyD family secretion protein
MSDGANTPGQGDAQSGKQDSIVENTEQKTSNQTQNKSPQQLLNAQQPQQPSQTQPSVGVQSSQSSTNTKTSNVNTTKKKPIIILVVVIALIALVAFQLIRNKPEGKDGWLRINGRIEGYEVNVGAKIAGRVEYISNREGDEVKYLQPLVKLSDEDIRAQLKGAKARYQGSLNSVQEAEALVNVSKEQVEQAKLNVTQSREDARGRIDQAEANVASQKAQLSEALAQEVQAKADLALAAVRQKRYDDLVVKGAVTQDEDDQAHSTFESTKATVEARIAAAVSAKRQVSAAEAALIQAKSNALNPPIRLSQQASSSRTVSQNEAALMRARQDVKNAKASIEEIESNIAYLNINSPIHGVVTARTVEPGAVVAAGQTVISLINLDTVYLRAYVPDSEIGKVRLHQKALIYYDSNPKHGISGRVIEIDPEASFTPENIYFRDDRVKQVFGIKILIDNPSNYAKPGMPADADIDISEKSGETSS